MAQATRRKRSREVPSSRPKATNAAARESPAPQHVTERLFPVVVEEFSRKIYNDVNIRDISRISGVSAATIYKYFTSKEGLIISVLDDALDGLAERVTVAIDGVASYRQKWEVFYRTAMRWYDEKPAIAIVVNVSLPPEVWFRPSAQWPLTAIPEVLRGLVAAGRKLGELDKAISDSQILALHFMHMRHEVNYWFSEQRRWLLESRVKVFFPLFWKAVAAADPTPPARAKRRSGRNKA